MRQQHWLSLLIVGLLLSGCADVSTPPATNTSASPAETDSGEVSTQAATATEGSATETAAATEIPLEIKSWNEIQDWIASQRGRVVVVDVWSTSCLTCLQEFPHFVELHQKYGDRVACASLSVDFYGGEGNKPEDVRPQVEKFLTSRRASMPNFISSDPDKIVLRHIETAVIPAALVYDREGKLRKVFNNDKDEYGPKGFNYQDNITPFVEELLQSET